MSGGLDLRRTVGDYGLTLPGSYEDYPFGPDWMVLRHRGNGKSFALLYLLGERPQCNLKCDPMEGDFLRRAYPGRVLPAYHMNKTHWNSVMLDGSLPVEEIFPMVGRSYELTRPKSKRQGKDEKR